MSSDIVAISGRISSVKPGAEAVIQQQAAPERKKSGDAWSCSLDERRASPRLDVQLSTTLRFQDLAWKGVTKSISRGGLSLVVTQDVPAELNQQIRLSFQSDAVRLESLGVVCGIRTGRSGSPLEKAGTTLAIRFVRMSPSDEEVLGGFLSEGRVRSKELRLLAALVAQDNEEVLVESAHRVVAVRGPVSEAETAPARIERRRHRRVRLDVGGEMTFRDGEGRRSISGISVKDVTPTGACVLVPSEDDLMGTKVLLRWQRPGATNERRSVVPIRGGTCTVEGQVVWARPESQASGSTTMGSRGRTMLAGVRFLSVERETEALLQQLCVQTLDGATPIKSDAPSVITVFGECTRQTGERIALCHDRSRLSDDTAAPIVVLAPGYGESKRDYVPLAYYLAGNGFEVVRYDNVNHVGESDGVVTQFRLQDMEIDLETVLHHVATRWPGRPIGLVATSLAGRVALKVTGRSSRVKLLLLINGIMDVRHTLQAVHQEDLIGEHLAGVRKGVVNILGLTIDADRWLAQAVEGQYADLATTQTDGARVGVPVVLFHAEHDAWVDPASIQAVEQAIGPQLRHSYVVPGALHRIQESPRKARAVYRQIAESCRQELWPNHDEAAVVEPSHREISLQNRVERERGKSRRPIAKSEHVEFWRDYLNNFHTIPNVADFWSLMDQVYRLMGDCRQGERILDAGCGNGNFGVFLQLNQAFRQRYAARKDAQVPDYVGLDFVPAALSQATKNFAQVQEALQEQFRTRFRTFVPMSMQVCRADLESPLPFPDHSFDRVICNLVIGYVRDPLFTLREYLRVLAPNGRLVISNLKPYADLSAIYRNFVETARTADQVEEGRRLLDNSGKIKAREGEGVFHFLHQAELEGLLRAAGLAHPRVYSTFGNQALLAVAEKDLASMPLAA